MIKPLLKVSLIAVFLTSTLTACKQAEDATDGSSSGGGMTLGNVAKTWNSGCLAGSDTITGADHRKVTLYLGAAGTFNWMEIWYTGSSCTGANYTIAYSSVGTYSIVTELTPGVYDLAFIVNSSTMMAFTTAAQASVNFSCGGTSPYQGTPSSSDNGVSKSTYQMLCNGMTLPNSGNKAVDNMGSYSGGVLSLGDNDNGVPGIFQGTNPNSPTVDFY